MEECRRCTEEVAFDLVCHLPIGRKAPSVLDGLSRFKVCVVHASVCGCMRECVFFIQYMYVHACVYVWCGGILFTHMI